MSLLAGLPFAIARLAAEDSVLVFANISAKVSEQDVGQFAAMFGEIRSWTFDAGRGMCCVKFAEAISACTCKSALEHAMESKFITLTETAKQAGYLGGKKASLTERGKASVAALKRFAASRVQVAWVTDATAMPVFGHPGTAARDVALSYIKSLFDLPDQDVIIDATAASTTDEATATTSTTATAAAAVAAAASIRGPVPKEGTGSIIASKATPATSGTGAVADADGNKNDDEDAAAPLAAEANGQASSVTVDTTNGATPVAKVSEEDARKLKEQQEREAEEKSAAAAAAAPFAPQELAAPVCCVLSNMFSPSDEAARFAAEAPQREAAIAKAKAAIAAAEEAKKQQAEASQAAVEETAAAVSVEEKKDDEDAAAPTSTTAESTADADAAAPADASTPATSAAPALAPAATATAATSAPAPTATAEKAPIVAPAAAPIVVPTIPTFAASWQQELREDVTAQVAGLRPVTVVVDDWSVSGRVFVRFPTEAAASRCRQGLDMRSFGQRVIRAHCLTGQQFRHALEVGVKEKAARAKRPREE